MAKGSPPSLLGILAAPLKLRLSRASGVAHERGIVASVKVVPGCRPLSVE